MVLPHNLDNQQPEPVDPLTEREIEILRLLADGWTDRKRCSYTFVHDATMGKKWS